MTAATKFLQKIALSQHTTKASPHGMYLSYLLRESRQQHAFVRVAEYDASVVSRMGAALQLAHPSYSLVCYGSKQYLRNTHYIRSWTHAPSKTAIVLLETFDAPPQFPSSDYSYILDTYYKPTHIMESVWYTQPPTIIQRISDKSHVTLATPR